MQRLAISRCDCAESRVVVGLDFDPVLTKISPIEATWPLILTAPYLEMCLTKSEANLNRGRGTMVKDRRLTSGRVSEAWI
jgi:hypothetical protein